ncbi:MAG: hypothetical protein SFY32_14815 [Bacteroidota bacterium]|nr:hypothetical protein [Bacteroidota bacterium]
MKNLLVLLIIFSCLLACKTQKKIRLRELYEKAYDEVTGENKPIDTAKAPTLALTNAQKKEDDAKVKRPKPRVFYGFKTKRAYTRKGKDIKKREYQIFFVLKKWVEPSPYVRDIHWYHKKKRQIIIGPITEDDKPYARILHGPYMKRVGRKVIEEGIFYVGAKHGRWAKYDRNFILLDKKRFYKGWPTDSKVTYYDLDQKKPKEVVPIQWGSKEGDYLLFTEEGTLQLAGTYKDNVRIGIWTEYYPSKKKKKEIQYPKDPFVEDFEPYVIKEYNEKGKTTYDFRKDGKRADSTLVGSQFK